jgi:hypothetical protein
VTFMDSTALGTLVAAAKKVKARGGTLSVVGASDRIASPFHITKLDTVVPLCPEPGTPEALSSTRRETWNRGATPLIGPWHRGFSLEGARSRRGHPDSDPFFGWCGGRRDASRRRARADERASAIGLIAAPWLGRPGVMRPLPGYG